VKKTVDPGLVDAAVTLANTASIVTSLGNSQGSPQVYTAQGLLNTISKAGQASATSTPAPSAGTNTQEVAQQSTDQEIVQTLASSPETSGIYTSAGSLNATASTNNSSRLAVA